MLRIGDMAPDFTCNSSKGALEFHNWLGESWGILFSHPKDFTPVCTTELGTAARLSHEFDRRGVKLIGLSVDGAESHEAWMQDISETQGSEVEFPIIADSDLKVSKLYGMLPATSGATAEGRTAMDNKTVRTVFVIAPDKTIVLTMSYPMSTGRNFAEILRVIDSVQLTAASKVATPADWQPGEDVIILPSIPDHEAKQLFPQGWTAPKPYLRIVPQPE